MPVFQVATRRVTSVAAPSVRRSRALDRWFAVLRYNQAVLLVGATFGLTISIVHDNAFFFLLPISVSVAADIILGRVSLREPRALLCFIGVAALYFGGVTGLEIVSHAASTQEIIVVTTTLTIAVILEPLRALLQTFLEQHFRLRETADSRAITAFTAALREEIDLDAVREGFLDIAQKTMLPLSAAVWVRVEDDEGVPAVRGARLVPSSAPRSVSTTVLTEVTIDESDPLITHLREHTGALDLAWLQLQSLAVEQLRSDAVELALPLVSEGTLIGLLTLGPRMGGTSSLLPVPGLLRVLLSLLILGTYVRGQAYSAEDRQLLEKLAIQMAPAVRVAHLVRARQAQDLARGRIEQELHTAQQIQRTFLPKEVPSLPGWQLIPYYQPAREVGGDFYDFHLFDNGGLGLVLGDVTGKGIPAALMMTAARTMLRTAAHENATPAEILERVNNLLCADVPPGMFVTCFYALLDPGSGRLRFANAGQDLPYLRGAAGAARELHMTGMPLGLMPGTRYEEGVTTVEPGESLLFYSDGVVEAHNAGRAMFGERRLIQVVEQQYTNGTLIDTLLSAMAEFTGADWEQEDDVTLLLVQRQCRRDGVVPVNAQ